MREDWPKSHSHTVLERVQNIGWESFFIESHFIISMSNNLANWSKLLFRDLYMNERDRDFALRFASCNFRKKSQKRFWFFNLSKISSFDNSNFLSTNVVMQLPNLWHLTKVWKMKFHSFPSVTNPIIKGSTTRKCKVTRAITGHTEFRKKFCQKE